MFKVRYVAGGGVELVAPLSDGQSSFSAGIDYEIAELADFIRLVRSGSFEAVEIDDRFFDVEKFKKGKLVVKVATTEPVTAIDTPSRDPIKTTSVETTKPEENNV